MITAFLPCRSGSQRIKNKNTRLFCGIEGGLLNIKMQQLLSVKELDAILVSTNDDVVKKIVSSFSDSRIKIDDRCDKLSSSNTKTDDLIKYIPSIISEGDVLWTHITSPFVDNDVYEDAIKKYKKIQEYNNDSLMSVHKVQSFMWNKKGPINYDLSIEKWPRTQTLDPIYEVNSAFFISNVKNYIKYEDCILTYSSDCLHQLQRVGGNVSQQRAQISLS